jgi:regulator of protease activity HflC (stomatin/prohibitin superfamily)
MRRINALNVSVFIAICILGFRIMLQVKDITALIVFAILGFIVASGIQIASQWERAVLLRLGRYHRMYGPGVFFAIPIIDSISHWIDTRVITSTFRAEQTLTRDNVPVDVDAVLFWKVVDPEKAALEVSDYKEAITWASQTALREIIGKTDLSTMLMGREELDKELRRIIDERSQPWGIHVISVEIRDVLIPSALQDAMSKQAQAERERQARIILGESETQIAHMFEEAARFYESNPTALHLRAMNMLYEGLREKGSIIIVPSTAVETMNLGSMLGMASASKSFVDEGVRKESDG